MTMTWTGDAAANHHASNSVRWKYVLSGIFLLFCVLLSALGVIVSSYQSRQLFNDWQQAQHQSVYLEEEWSRLLLEESTWSSPSRVEQLALSELQMQAPDSRSIVVVKK